MKQTILAVVLELQPQAVQQAKLGARAFANVRPRLSEIETLHFMSITVFDQEQHYDPLLLIEANFDGEARFFWAELIAQAGQELMDVVRYCKMDRVDRKEATPTTPITPADLPAFLERHTVLPSASHRGNRGLSRNRILAEAELYRKTQEIIDTPDPHGDKSSLLALRQGNARKLHRALRKYPGLVIPPADPARRDAFERVGDWLPVILIVLAILAAGFLAAAPWSILGDGGQGIRYFIDGLLFAGLIVLTVSLLLLAILVPVLRRVRRLELTDPVQDWPHTPENRLQALLDAEADRGGGYKTVQNHLASMVLVKPGILRAMIISIGMTLLNRIVRINAVDGYLGSMRTIHFAH